METPYINLLKKTLKAKPRQTRNSITLSSFGERLEFDLSYYIPLLTTKKMAWKTIIKELLWFVKGDTDNQKLIDEKVYIWNGNASREFLNSRGLIDREVNDLGAIYGFQWRHSGAVYKDCHSNYKGKGIDQLEECRNLIINNPTSRRIIFTAWNPSDLPKMALPPCHILGQWYVDDDILSLQVYQRSSDVFLGLPFNIFSYSVLIHMMAHLTNKKVGKLIYILGDTHIYQNQIEVCKEQINRKIHNPPRFNIIGKINRWEDFKLDSFELIDYTCEGCLKVEMIA